MCALIGVRPRRDQRAQDLRPEAAVARRIEWREEIFACGRLYFAARMDVQISVARSRSDGSAMQ